MWEGKEHEAETQGKARTGIMLCDMCCLTKRKKGVFQAGVVWPVRKMTGLGNFIIKECGLLRQGKRERASHQLT